MARPSRLLAAVLIAVCASSAAAQTLGFTATNGIAAPTSAPEAHVRLAWTSTGTAGELYQIRRARITGGVTGAFGVLAVRPEGATEYLDTGALPGVSYAYALDAMTSGRTGSATGSRVLRRPAALAATDSTRLDGAFLSWADVSSVEQGYVVFRGAPGAPPTVAGLTALDTTGVDASSFLDAAAVTLQTYQYCVGLLYTAGGVTSVAEPLACDRGTRGAVLPPGGVAATDGTIADRVRVAWAARPGATFAVTRRATGVPRQTLASGLAASPYDDLAAVSGLLYTYCVTATTPAGTSVPACATGRRGSLAPPTGVAAADTTSDAGVDVTWTDAGPTETGFRIYRTPVAGGAAVLVTTTPANRTNYTDLAALPDVRYSYCVAAAAAATVGGATVTSESARVCDPGERSGLLRPTTFVATDGAAADAEGYAALSWASASTAVQLFQVLRGGQPIATLAPFDRSYRDALGLSGTVYTYQVRAVTVLADNPAAITQGLAPLLTRAAADRVALDVERDNAREAVAATDDAAAAEAASETLARIDTRADAVETALVRDVQALLAGLGIDARSLTAPGLPDAAASAGLRFAASATDAGTRRLRAPETVVATTALEDRVRLTWADRSAIETGYEVRATYPAPTPERVQTLGPNRTEWIDLGSPAGVAVTYRIRTVDRPAPVESASAWVTAAGRRDLLPAGRLAAVQTDAENRVLVTWRDSSRAETGYAVTAALAAGTWTGTAAANARQTTVPIQPADFGRATAVTVRATDALGASVPATVTVMPTYLAPRVVTASTAYPDRVVVSWTDDSQANQTYRVTRNGVLVSAFTADATTFTDATPVGTASYCVVPVGSNALASPAPVCAEGRTSTTTVASTGDVVTGAVVASNLNAPGSSANFGAAVAAGGGGAIVGAPQDAVGVTSGEVPGWSVPWSGGITTGSPFPSGGGYRYGGVRSSVGMVSLYSRTAAGWADAGRIQVGPSTPMTYNEFGASVDVEGSVALVGAPGTVYWTMHPATPVSNVYSYAWSDGGAYLYQRGSGGAWSRVKLLRAPGLPDNQYATVTDGTNPVAADAGISLTTVYQYSAGSLTGYSTSPGTGAIQRFGERVALTPDWAFVSYFNNGAWTVARYQASANWTHQGNISPPLGFDPATNSTLAADAGTLAIASPRPLNSNQVGQVDLHFVTPGGVTTAPFSLISPSGATGEYGGGGLDVRGSLLAVGAPGAGANAVYLYRKSTAAYIWSPEATLAPQAGDTRFGAAVSISDGFVAVSATAASGQGVVYMFRQQGTTWNLASRLTQEGPVAAALFGRAVAASADDIVIGAPGTQTTTGQTGAVYFATVGVTPTAVAASDGRYANRVQVRWNDEAASETGYRVYRRGPTEAAFVLVGTTAANAEVYDDFDVAPGAAYSYCVASFLGSDESDTNPLGESARVCDTGWTPPNGSISGRLATGQGGAVGGSQVCLTPGPDQAVNLDGLGGRAAVPGFGQMPATFTIEAWVNGDAFAGGQDNIRSVAGIESAGTALLRVGDAGIGSSLPQFAVTSLLTALPAIKVTATQALTPGRWHHLAGTIDASRVMRLYVDGVLQGTATLITAPAALGDFNIGSNGGGRFFDGRVDEVRVWSTARTAAEIAAASRTPLRGDEAGLYAYWPVEQGRGRVLPDLTRAGRNALLDGGAEWTRAGAPLDVCARTTPDGNYTFPGIRYGETTSFRIVPTDSTRQFTPEARTATLTPQSPTQNQVDFTDTSSYTVRGSVAHAVDQITWPGQPALPAPAVNILVDGIIAGTSASDGTFAVAVNGARQHVLEARVGGLTFTAALGATVFADGTAEITPTGDVDGLRFTNVTQHTLRGQAAGGCARPIGNLTFRVTTDDRRFDRTFTTAGSAPYALSLPPIAFRLEYVDIAGVPTTLDRVALVDYFRNLGVLQANLVAAVDTVDFRYRAPIVLAITGLAEPVASCSAGYRVVDAAGVERQLLPSVPVITEYDRPRLTIRAYEDYGAGGQCPVDVGTVRIFDGFADAAGTPVTVPLANGVARYTSFGRSPDTFSGRTVEGVDRSYQKSLTAVLEIPDGPSVTTTQWAFVEGYREKPATFVTATMSEIPVLILRDPPGTASSAFVERGTNSCTSLSQLNTFTGAGGIQLDLKLGLKTEIGIFVTTDVGGAFNLQTTTLLGGGVTQTNGPPESNMQVCATTTERWETSGDTGWSGEDLYAGVGLNFIFAEADQLDTDAGTCRIRLSNVLAADFDAPDPVETAFVYGSTHIRNTVIPLLERRIRLAGTPTGTGTPTGPAPQAVLLRQSVGNWNGMLAYNDSLATAALAGDVDNHSFGAGASYQYGVAADTTLTTSRTQRVTFSTDTRFGGIITAGYDNSILGVVQLATEQTFGTDTAQTNSFGTGYSLADSDAGDYFSVDTARDPRYGTFVFNTVSGASSNPWEPNTQQRDRPRLAINPPIRDRVLNGTAAPFTLSLTNASDSNERREYVIEAPPHLNPGGAVIKATGIDLATRRYLVEAGQTISIPITVERGPEASITDYRIALIAYPEFDYNIWRTAPQFGLATSDTVRFEVRFTQSVAALRLVEPLDGWTVRLDQPTVRLTLGDIDVQHTPQEQVGVQFRRPGEAWDTAVSATGDQFPGTSYTTVWTPPAAIADGLYELRPFARRAEAAGPPPYYGPTVPGRIDRTAPAPFGLPEPADRVLALGETIGVTFDEAVDCPRLRRDLIAGATLAQIVSPTGVSPALSVTCAERTVLMAPQDASAWSVLEGQLVTARLRGVRDLAGNPMARAATADAGWDASWRFTVRRNAFGWTPAVVAVRAQPGVPTEIAAALVNGRAQPVAFDLVPHNAAGLPFTFDQVSAGGVPTGVQVRVTTAALAGTVVSGDLQPVAFRWPGAAEGTYRAVINVHSVEAGEDLGMAPLDVTVVVACQAPAWAVNAAAFETNMTITADLRMAGASSSDPADRLAAFVDGQVRGVASPVLLTASGSSVWRVPLVVYGTGARDRVTFQAWDQSACMLHRTTSQVVEFAANGALGSVASPLVIEAPGAGGAPLAEPLARGWTWVSTNRQGTTTLASALVGVGAAETDLIQSANGFSQFVPGSGWFGSVTGMAPGRGYHIRLQTPATMTHPGAPVGAGTPIPVLAGWNWIGFLPQAPLAVTAALASLTPATDDLIKSQTAYAQYVQGVGWVGSLATLRAGAGYQLFVAEDGTLAYPGATSHPEGLAPDAPRPVQRFDTLPVQAEPGTPVVLALPMPEAPAEVSDAPTVKATVDGSAFEHSMTVTAAFDGAPAGTHVAAYAVTPDGEALRAVAPVQRIDVLNGTRVFLLVPGAAADSLVLRTVTGDGGGGWTPDAGPLVIAGATPRPAAMAFVRDAVVGTAAVPIVLERATATAGEDETPAVLALSPTRPNPLSAVATFEYALPAPTTVRLSLYDILGREVAVIDSGDRPAGVHAIRFDARPLASGTYVVRLVAGSDVRVQRITVTR